MEKTQEQKQKLKDLKQKLQREYFKYEKQYYKYSDKCDEIFPILFGSDIDMISYYKLSLQYDLYYARARYFYKCKEYIYRELMKLG